MKAKLILPIIIAAVVGVLVAAGLAAAQETPLPPEASAPKVAEPKSAPQKASKVWTNDDIGSVRSLADGYTEEKEAQAAAAAAKQASSTAKAASPAQGGARPALAHPKTGDDADKMIAWENRDIDAQQETVARLQKELDEAPPEQKEALQKSLQEKVQLLAETRQELQALQAKKEELQKQASTGGNPVVDKPPSQ